MASRARDNGAKRHNLSPDFLAFFAVHAETLNECMRLVGWHRCPLRAWGVVRPTFSLSYFLDFNARKHRARQGTTVTRLKKPLVQRLGTGRGENAR